MVEEAARRLSDLFVTSDTILKFPAGNTDDLFNADLLDGLVGTHCARSEVRDMTRVALQKPIAVRICLRVRKLPARRAPPGNGAA